ncbi:bifunctional 2-polyprenyl-6-hydroxyphenol methylase/3-demethylubiquinol 3-O-methyltransferase UbiG [Pseudoruegeria sp. HB172150]|uniref:class I SAM-dependent methyltransferase n=1 Tax=Pseudoruegeria sp. HB172150 TaxID=2721164 RepID=UPI001C1329E4|nr:methyltransferase domain-containing protein [Pseudoruegeria sp. HB172150]
MNSDAAFWDRAAARYAKSPVKNVPAWEATLTRVRAYLKPEDRVLETGCGTGSTALKLAGSVREYVATDVSAEMIAIAREKAAAAGAANVAFAVAPAEADAAETESFDAVLGFNLLHLVSDLDAAIAQARAQLKTGGYYITKTACLREMNPLIRLVLLLMRAVGKAPNVLIFSREELEAAIRNGGFEIVEMAEFEGAKNVRFLVAKKV